MPDVYGSNTALLQIRAALVTHMNGLKTAMVSGSVVPALAAVYPSIFEETALVFPSVAITILPVLVEFEGPSSGTHVTKFDARAGIRVLLDNARADVYPDEITLCKLYNSIINYLEERHLLAIGPEMRWFNPAELSPVQFFEDTRTMGGLVSFNVRVGHQIAAA